MNISFPRSLTVLAAVVSTATVTLAKEVDLWFIPMSAENPFKEPILKWVKENFPKMLPKDVTAGDNYGPPIYQDAQQKFVVQGRNGKPDVIESVLEGMIAYKKPACSSRLTATSINGPTKTSSFRIQSKP